jgi:hypothetical protein
MTSMQALCGAVAKGVVAAQTELDERGRDSFDAFEDDVWSSVVLEIPASLLLRPKQAAGGVAAADVEASAGGRLKLRMRYYLSPQGVDDPRPHLDVEEA